MRFHGMPVRARLAVGALIVVGLLTGANPLVPGSWAATPNQACANPLAVGKAKLSQGQAQAALPYLESAVKKDPGSCEANLCLGQAHLKLKNYVKARLHLRTAVRVGKGSANAQKANLCLMSMPSKLIAPKTGKDTRMIALNFGLVGRDRGQGEVVKPTVIDFYATWCHPCKQLQPIIERAKAQYGESVNFVSINVDDPNNEQVIEQYEVSPVPTMVFLNPDGEVVTYTIGFSGEQALQTGLKKILVKG